MTSRIHNDTDVKPPQRSVDDSLPWTRGLLMGCLGMLAFSGTLAATRVAVPAFGPLVLTAARILIAATLCAATLLVISGRRLPTQQEWPGIAWTGLGLGVGYPLFVALALDRVPAAHGAVVVGLAPAATAVISVLRTGERPGTRFWIGCTVGAFAVLAFAVEQGGGRIALADGWLFAAMVSVGLAYVEGGRVSRTLGPTVTLCWSMLLLAPFAAIPIVASYDTIEWRAISAAAWIGFFYVGVVSMYAGSIAWYCGLSAGGIARIGQLNLATPMLALVWAWLCLGEAITWPFILTSVVVVAAMTVCVRSRIG